jgi:hypothetical protein
MLKAVDSEKGKATMWHIICLCLPAVTRSEQQRFFTLFKDVLHAYGREPNEMDLSLFFLYVLPPEEALTVLEERLDLVIRSQELLVQRGEHEDHESTSGDMQALVTDHMRTLLAAEHEWLRRAISQLRSLTIDGLLI